MRYALFLMCGALFADVGTTPRPSPDAWPAHADAGGGAVSAEFDVRTVVLKGKSIWVKKHLVVEVGVYPPRAGANVHASQFALRLNGSRGVLYGVSPSSAAVFVRHPDYGGGLSWEAGTGGIYTGSDTGRTRGRLPDPVPPPPRTPGAQREDGTPPDDPALIIDAALPQGPTREPVSGYLYFYWDGKTQKLKSVELLYTPEGSSQPVALRLR